MLQKLLKLQKEYIDFYFASLDLDVTEHLMKKIEELNGTLFITGVGKSGFIAQKMAATFVSIGIKAMYLNPINALHGDIGILDKEDLFICLSKSGESVELLNLIPYVRNKDVEVVSIVSSKNNRLVKASNHVIYLPLDKELCPHNVVPTTSCELQLIYGDFLAVALMEKLDVSLTNFALNHPAGKIGKRLSLRVEELMLSRDQLPLCSLDDKLVDVLEIFSQKKCGCLIVLDHNKALIGIFTDGDLRRALQKHGSKLMEMSLKDLKILNPKVILEKKLVWEALQLMEEDQSKPIMVLPVVDKDRRVKGLIKMHDILQSGVS